MLTYLNRVMAKLKAKALVGLAIPPRTLDCGRLPVFGKSLPVKMGSGGWPVEEPTQQELDCFLALLRKVPIEYFGSSPRYSPDYGDQYSCAITVKEWLELISEAKLLAQKE